MSAAKLDAEIRSLFYDPRENRNRGGWVLIIKRGDFATRTVLQALILETQRDKAEEIAATKTFESEWRSVVPRG